MAIEQPGTAPDKAVRSAVGPSQRGLPFGQPAATVPPIDTFASTTDYRKELAYLLAVISAWSYSDEKVLAAKLTYYGLPGARIRRITIVNNALLVATTAYLIQSESGKVAVLAFRGTDPANIIALLTDGQVMLQPFFDAHVHSGFHASVEVVWDDVHQALLAAKDGLHIAADGSREQLPNKLEALYVTGHSLGGAMAVLAAARLVRSDYATLFPPALLRGVYTYGQPMVGNAQFVKACAPFAGRLYRHVYHRDVVPQLPPRSELDYVHAGTEYRSNALDQAWEDKGKISERAGLAESVAFVTANALEARLTARDFIPGPSIDDHMPAQYLEVSRYTLNPQTRVIESRSLLERAASAVSKSLSGLTSLIG